MGLMLGRRQEGNLLFDSFAATSPASQTGGVGIVFPAGRRTLKLDLLKGVPIVVAVHLIKIKLA